MKVFNCASSFLLALRFTFFEAGHDRGINGTLGLIPRYPRGESWRDLSGDLH